MYKHGLSKLPVSLNLQIKQKTKLNADFLIKNDLNAVKILENLRRKVKENLKQSFFPLVKKNFSAAKAVLP